MAGRPRKFVPRRHSHISVRVRNFWRRYSRQRSFVTLTTRCRGALFSEMKKCPGRDELKRLNTSSPCLILLRAVLKRSKKSSGCPSNFNISRCTSLFYCYSLYLVQFSTVLPLSSALSLSFWFGFLTRVR